MGIDLASNPRNRSGYFLESLPEGRREWGNFREDFEIVRIIKKYVKYEKSSLIISLDSPLSYDKVPFRDCELELIRKYKVRLLPLSLKSMRDLYMRAIKLSSLIKSIHKSSIFLETHPRTIETIYNLSRLRKLFQNEDVYDAFLCYLTSYSFYRKKFLCVKGQMYFPSREIIEEIVGKTSLLS